MKRFIVILMVMTGIMGCGSERLLEKSWHTSPSSDPLWSTIYPMVDWSRVELVKVGMSQEEAEQVLEVRLQFFHHPINAILFTTHPNGRHLEVALKLSQDRHIEDISYKERLK